MSGMEAFGYRREPIAEVHSVQVAEGKDDATLQPLVVIKFRLEPDSEQIAYGIDPDRADALADELRRWAARAREKHWD